MKQSETINVVLPEEMLAELERLEDSKLGTPTWADTATMDEKIALVLFYPKKTKAALSEYFEKSLTSIQKYYRLWRADPEVQAEIAKRQSA